jgi:uncharacterized Tic20 family protein
MAEEGSMAVVVIGYLLAIFIPILGLIMGAVLYFLKKDEVPLYAKHGKFIMILALILFIIGILFMVFGFTIALGATA